MPGFGDIVKETLAFKAFAGELPTTSTINHIPLNEICVIYKNKYINNIDKHQSLKESIRLNGLIEPIIVIEIDAYISTNEVEAGEVGYLETMKDKGCKYFISSGHRRFKAYASIAMGEDLYTDDDLNVLYSNEFVEKYTEKKNAPTNIEDLFDFDDELKWFEIPCKVAEISNEDAIYNDSNTTQREITSFEIIDNAIDEMKKNGKWDETIERIKKDRIISMTDRALRDNIKSLVSAGVITTEVPKKKEQQRELLFGVDSKYIPGIDSPLNEAIAKYIYENKQRKVSVASVNNTRKMLNIFSEPLVKCIYDGLISARDAQN